MKCGCCRLASGKISNIVIAAANIEVLAGRLYERRASLDAASRTQ